jgi:hypothetical protein
MRHEIIEGREPHDWGRYGVPLKDMRRKEAHDNRCRLESRPRSVRVTRHTHPDTIRAALRANVPLIF